MNNKIILYLKLMRADKPIGYYLLFWPVIWAFLIATSGNPNLYYLSIFVFGVLATRSAGCIINDYFDQNLDRKVNRTKNRVLANQLVTNHEALILFFLLIIFCFILLLMLGLEILLFAIFSITLLVLYPLSKRYFKLPQLILGLAFGSSIPMIYILEKNLIDLNCILIYLTTVLWAIVYDTYYAMADKKDDLKLGVKSSAIFFGENDIKYTLYIHYIVILLFLIVGLINNFNMIYYLFIFISLMSVLYQNLLVRNRLPYQCIAAFENNNIFGLIITFGLISNYL